jgi:hypothetical protein
MQLQSKSLGEHYPFVVTADSGQLDYTLQIFANIRY